MPQQYLPVIETLFFYFPFEKCLCVKREKANNSETTGSIEMLICSAIYVSTCRTSLLHWPQHRHVLWLAHPADRVDVGAPIREMSSKLVKLVPSRRKAFDNVSCIHPSCKNVESEESTKTHEGK